jgi:hypothetical protein
MPVRVGPSHRRMIEASPEFPDPLRQDLSIWPGPARLPTDLSQQVMFRIAGKRSREDEALQGHKKPSLWKRLLGRLGQ